MTAKIRTITAFALLVSTLAFAAEIRRGGLLDWGNSPEAYFLTAEERKQWDTVTTQEAAEKFIAEYWRKHGEAFRREVQLRIAAADKHFGLEDVVGSKTEMGRVFMILGAPNKQHRRGTARQAGGNNIGVVDWQYNSDRLPKDIGVERLDIRFQTESSKSRQTIENPGRVEPFLRKAVDLMMAQQLASVASQAVAVPPPATAAAPSLTAAPVVDPALWNTPPNLAGAFFTGEPFITPTEKTFYAYSFYLPKSVAALAAPQNIVMAGAIRDAAGSLAATFRQEATPAPYDASGDRYADGSVELAPGKYTGVFAMYAEDGSTILATARTEFEIPEVTITRVSRPLLTSKIDTLESQAAFDPFTFIATKYAVKGNNRFRKADSVGFFTFIANPVANPDPNMSFRMKVLRGSTVVEQSPMMPANLQQTGPHTYLLATRFEPNTLSPGHYKLEITVKDMNAPKDSEAYMKGYVRSVEFDVTE